MSIKQKLEKSAKTLSRFSGLLGESIRSLFPLSNGNVYFNVTDGKSYSLLIRDLESSVSEGKVQPVTLELIASSANFLDFFQGKLSFVESWVNEKIAVKGVRNNLMSALIIGMIVSS